MKRPRLLLLTRVDYSIAATFAVLAGPIASPSYAQSISPASGSLIGNRYGHLAPPDDNLKWLFQSSEPIGEATVTLLSCTSGTRFSVSGGKTEQQSVPTSNYFLTAAYVPRGGRSVQYKIRALTKDDTGRPFWVLLTKSRSKPDSNITDSFSRACNQRRGTDAVASERFGDFADLAGKTVVLPGQTVAYDYEWYVPGRVLLQSNRQLGKKWGCIKCEMITYDEANGRLMKQPVYAEGPAQDWMQSKLRKDVEVLAWQDDIRQRRAERAGSGGGLLGALQGAIAGAQGMVDAGGGMSEALAGASIGALGSSMGADPNSVRDSVSRGASDVAQSNAAAQRQFSTAATAANAPRYGSSGALSADPSRVGASGAGQSAPDTSVKAQRTGYAFCYAFSGDYNQDKRVLISRIGQITYDPHESMETRYGTEWTANVADFSKIHEKAIACAVRDTLQQAEITRAHQHKSAAVVELSWTPD